MKFWFLILLLAAGQAVAETGQVEALLAEQESLGAVRETLAAQRLRVAREADSLSARIDSLKRAVGDAEELQQALRSSVALVQRLVEIDQRLDSVTTEQEDLRERLRLAYDWEIGQLIRRLSQGGPDRELLLRLMLYQEAREALGEEVDPARMRYGEELAITPEDGPEEIRQKIELLEDMAGQLRAQAEKTAAELKRLEEERRLRNQVRIFTAQISLFDEHLPERRVVQQQVSAAEGPSTAMDLAPIKAGEEARSAPEGVVPEGIRHQASGGQRLSLERFAADDIRLEIYKLKAHQQEVRQMEAVLQERIEAFRQRLRESLEGRE